jgi:5-deoxy-glucuronate isomerase
MLIRHPEGFSFGYTPITHIGGRHSKMLMDFGILRLRPGERESSRAGPERAYLLLDGEVEFGWNGGARTVSRRSLFDEPPWCLHLPAGATLTVTAGARGAELACLATTNPAAFPPLLFSPPECREEERGKGTMREASTRIVRTIFDDSNAPHSNLVLGEAVTYPGRWSSYPPHHHPQPEIYHYRFLPAHGFGLTAVGEQAHILHHGDTVLIHEGEVHPQVAAPGYAMYYLWAIRHLEGNRYITPTFVPEHRWVMDPQAEIWPKARSQGGRH